MPANLPPQYYSVEAKLREAKTPEEKISIYEELLSLTPKHKGTENLQKDLKTKIAKLKKTIGSKKKTKREFLYIVKKEGAAQVAIVGPSNSGKSTLLNTLTNARAKTGSYPFVTKFPQPAMMPYEDILIQLIDTSPIDNNFFPPWLKEIVKTADGVLFIFDVTKPIDYNLIKEVEKLNKKILLVGNKIDLINNYHFANEEKIIYISCLKRIGLEELKQKIFNLTEIIRVYTKSPAKAPDFNHPFTFKKGSKLIDLAQEIHYDLAEKFKYARLFKNLLEKSKKPIIVGKDYFLEDGDIIEIHSN